MKNTIGIFQGKQAKYNILIMNILWDNGPLTAWEITGKIQNVSRISLHATLNKRLRDLEKKQYLRREQKKWFFQFKGMIASLIIQKNPKRWSEKWDELADFLSEFIEKYSKPLFGATVSINDAVFNFGEYISKNLKNLKDFNDWIALSDYYKEIMQRGVINFDLVSNQTLLTISISEASNEQLQAYLKDMDIKNDALQKVKDAKVKT